MRIEGCLVVVILIKSRQMENLVADCLLASMRNFENLNLFRKKRVIYTHRERWRQRGEKVGMRCDS